MTEQQQLSPPGWPFWAPSEARSVARALRLADVRAGDRFIDLGCGDGRVLVAAAKGGAHVVGVETDEELVEVARRHLEEEGVSGTVLHGDAFDVELDADVIFSYLSPAILQRLRSRFQRCIPGTRLVTIDFAVPGLKAARVVGGVHLYVLPSTPVPPARRLGWTSAGTLIAALPEYESLTTLELAHRGGPVALQASANLAEAAAFHIGTDHAEPGERVAIDLRWHELEEGMLVVGGLDVTGAGPHYVVVLFTHDDNGMWELSDEGVANVTARLARAPDPESWSELLATAEGAPNLRQ